MTTFFRTGKLGKSNGPISPTGTPASPSKKVPSTPLSPIERFIHDKLGPDQHDGTDKFFGMHNPSNTCYYNSVLQCLFHSEPFRQHVLEFPVRLAPGKARALGANPAKPVVDADAAGSSASGTAKAVNELWGPSKPKPAAMPTAKPDENKDSFDYQKKLAMNAGPFLTVDKGGAADYGMPESMFTSIKDIFEAMVAHDSRNGVVTPVKSLEILKTKYDVFRSNLHQDAHEFLNILLNEIVEEVEGFSRKHAADVAESTDAGVNGADATVEPSWVHGLFEGTLTSETRCLACENISQRDEVFLDLSVDLDEHTSVTSCLQKFSEEEMLCQRNKFHCDKCGGLQEAEKRMKVKRLPKILALHLKRFKYVEEAGQMQKLFHRVVYPFHLRLLNTTDDAEDPDKLYKLYAIIVHLGSTPFHGHYVAIVKTKHGWTLLDDELVLPVDKDYVRNFFGGGGARHPACAYVLFYEETTAEAMEEEQDPEDEPDQGPSARPPSGGYAMGPSSPTAATPLTPSADPFLSLSQTVSTPLEPISFSLPTSPPPSTAVPPSKSDGPAASSTSESRASADELSSSLKSSTLDALAASKPAKSSLRTGSFRALRHPSLSFRKRPHIFTKDKPDASTEEAVADSAQAGEAPPPLAEGQSAPTLPAPNQPTLESRKSRFGLGRKKSAMLS